MNKSYLDNKTTTYQEQFERKNKYVKLPREKIQFCGNTEEEKKANELIFDLTLENDSLQRENQQLREQLQQRDEVIKEIVSQVWYMQNNEPANSNEYDFYCRKLIWIATQKGDKNGN